MVEVLSPEECRALLASHNVGRLAIIGSGGRPDIFPVNYRLVGDDVVFLTNLGTKLEGADIARVAFEVDRPAPDGMSGWSVVVHGTAYDISTSVDHRSVSLRAIDVESALRGVRLVRIVAEETTGRRVRQEARET